MLIEKERSLLKELQCIPALQYLIIFEDIEKFVKSKARVAKDITAKIGSIKI